MTLRFSTGARLTWFAFTVLASAVAASAQDCFVLDAFEPNDTVPAPLGAGLHTELTFARSVPGFFPELSDRYLLVAPPRSRVELRFALTTPALGGATPPETFSGTIHPSTGSAVAFAIPGGPYDRLSPAVYENATDSNVDLTLTLSRPLIDGYGCFEYELDVKIGPRPCDSAPEDALEGPDDCATAVIIDEGIYRPLAVFGQGRIAGADADYFRIQSVQPGEGVRVIASTLAGGADLPLLRLDDTLPCGSPYTTGYPSVWLRNDHASARDFYLTVATDSRTDMLRYALSVERTANTCIGVVPDALEPNEVCGVATTIAPGNYPGLTIESEGDQYQLVVPPHSTLRATVTAAGTSPDPLVSIDTIVCSENLVQGTTSFTTGAQNTLVRVQVAGSSGSCETYDLDLHLQPAPCEVGHVDEVEPNDTCATATLLDLGPPPYGYAYLEQTLTPGDIDVLRVFVPPGTEWPVLSIGHATAEVRAYVGGDCTTTPYSGSTPTAGGPQWVELPNRTDFPLEYVIEIDAGSATTSCSTYTTQVGYLLLDPIGRQVTSHCTPGVMHAPPNADCASPLIVANGEFVEQWIGPGLSRHFATSIPTARTLFIDLDADALDELAAPVRLTLRNAASSCAVGAAPLDSFVVRPGDTNLVRRFANTTGAPLDVAVELGIKENFLVCGAIDMQLAIGPTIAYVETCLPYPLSGIACPCDNSPSPGAPKGCANSSGRGASLAADGSNRVVLDDLFPRVVDAPPGAVGALHRATPLGAQQPPFTLFDGLWCLGAGPMKLLSTHFDAAGNWTATIPLAGLLGALPGQSARLQFWYRDAHGPCGSGANTTNAIQIDWI